MKSLLDILKQIDPPATFIAELSGPRRRNNDVMSEKEEHSDGESEFDSYDVR